MRTPLLQPGIAAQRLPLYLRTVSDLSQQGIRFASSYLLAERLRLSAAQVRKDLSLFGEFGKQGIGYPTGPLREQLARLLAVNTVWDVALVGAGDVGRALVAYDGFPERGFHISAVFDTDPAKIGRPLHSLTIQDAAGMAAVIRRNDLRIAIVAVPPAAAQRVTDQLVNAGIQAILNYAPVNLTLPNGVCVENIDPVLHLQRLTFRLAPEAPAPAPSAA